MMSDRSQTRLQKKLDYRKLRAKQVREGVRPRREKPRSGAVRFATANVTQDSTWKEEDEHGAILRGISYLAIQEHGQQDQDKVDGIERRIRASGGGPAYTKNSDPGGGTALVARAEGGLGRLSRCEDSSSGDSLRGRCSVGIGNIGRDFAFASTYGHSGAGAAAQYSLWSKTASTLLGVGLPFVWAADWQVAPAELEASGLPRLLDACICAPREPTNSVTGTIIDYFLVSNALLVCGWQVQVSHDCIFSPHKLVTLELSARNGRAPCNRIARPRPYPPDPPAGPHPPGIRINWGTFDHARSIDASLEQWYAAAECEIATLYGVAATEDEVAHMGLGQPPRQVADSRGGRF